MPPRPPDYLQLMKNWAPDTWARSASHTAMEEVLRSQAGWSEARISALRGRRMSTKAYKMKLGAAIARERRRWERMGRQPAPAQPAPAQPVAAQPPAVPAAAAQGDEDEEKDEPMDDEQDSDLQSNNAEVEDDSSEATGAKQDGGGELGNDEPTIAGSKAGTAGLDQTNTQVNDMPTSGNQAGTSGAKTAGKRVELSSEEYLRIGIAHTSGRSMRPAINRPGSEPPTISQARKSLKELKYIAKLKRQRRRANLSTTSSRPNGSLVDDWSDSNLEVWPAEEDRVLDDSGEPMFGEEAQRAVARILWSREAVRNWGREVTGAAWNHYDKKRRVLEEGVKGAIEGEVEDADGEAKRLVEKYFGLEKLGWGG
ncbi:hypothetical protein BU26DRAFT_564588 [Trematosphaeria pertusa]|uniref:Uncharacterized protein n=1 Tax=Trematosphaeria pertusa TaxID=390896 RepID=A0A6A6IER8_9PLEO|nr:uncharacterized protein BU26DRAFT_564588 [Trematosphaeria pertusa]KAF2248896.1 hypothetical protein BU26DRAFT_564588 [Trematosphaeria pertusa]